MTFFIDVGFLIQLNKHRSNHPEIENDWNQITNQIQAMIAADCAVQLHIHPHWETATYTNQKWLFNIDQTYKLSDFPQPEAEQIVRKYTRFLFELTGKKVHSFRAGGWCIQPFSQLASVFKELGIVADSSVFPGGKMETPHYAFDFTSIPPFSSTYRFESDVCVKETEGYFTEFPIASWLYSPFFYWRLYVLGRLFPHSHRMWGDGIFLAQPGRKQSVLTSKTWNHVSSDGYYASFLHKQFKSYLKHQVDVFVVIGHPKGLTNYSFQKLKKFIHKTKSTAEFVTFDQLTCTL